MNDGCFSFLMTCCIAIVVGVIAIGVIAIVIGVID